MTMDFKADHSTDFEVQSQLQEVPIATKKLFSFLEQIQLTDSDRFDIRLSFEEMIINAMKHGNHFNQDLVVNVLVSCNPDAVYIRIQDEGDGFDTSLVKDPTEDVNLAAYSGRGVYLARHLMTQFAYSNNGNEVEFIKVLNQSS